MMIYLEKDGKVKCLSQRRFNRSSRKMGYWYPMEDCNLRFDDEVKFYEHLDLHELNEDEKHSAILQFRRTKKRVKYL